MRVRNRSGPRGYSVLETVDIGPKYRNNKVKWGFKSTIEVSLALV